VKAIKGLSNLKQKLLSQVKVI